MALTKAQIDAFLAQQEEAKKKFVSGPSSDIKKIQVGDNRYRILPNWKTKDPLTFEAYRAYAKHYIKHPDGENKGKIKTVTLCHKSTYNEKCPVCQTYFQHYYDETIPEDAKALLKEANAGTRVLVNALHINGIEPDKVIVLELPYGVFTDIFGDPRKGSQGFVQSYLSMKSAMLLDLEEGSDLIIRRSGQGFNTRYAVELPRSDSNPVPSSVLDHLVDLDAVVDAWKHTDEEEKIAVDTLNQIAGGGTESAASINMAAFMPQTPSEPVAAPTPSPATSNTVAKPPAAQEPLDMADADDILAELDLAI